MLTGLTQRPLIHADVPNLVTFWGSGFAASRAIMTYVVERGMSSDEFLTVARAHAPLFDQVRNEVTIFSRFGWEAVDRSYKGKQLSMTDSQRLALFRHDVAGMEGFFPEMVRLAEADKERLKSWYGHAQFLYRKRLAVEQLIKGICYLFHPQASEKGIHVKSRVDLERCFSIDAFDPAKAAFKNIISNGIKYGKCDGEFHVWNEGLKLFFKDDGVGMNNNFAARLGRGLKLREMRTDAPGEGLGWMSIGDVARTLKWRWEINSVINQGTTVVITLNESNFVPPDYSWSETDRTLSKADPISIDAIVTGCQIFANATPFQGYQRKGDVIWVNESPIYKVVEQACGLVSTL